VTGSPFTDPYTLWWSSTGSAFGPGIGMALGGHTLQLGIQNAGVMLSDLAKGFVRVGMVLMDFPAIWLWALRKNRIAWLTMTVLPAS